MILIEIDDQTQNRNSKRIWNKQITDPRVAPAATEPVIED